MNLKTDTTNRRGVAVVAVAIVLIVATSVMLVLAQGMLFRRQQLAGQTGRIQSQQLVSAGIQRALAQLKASPKYRGETWKIPAAQLDGVRWADVVIAVDEIANQAGKLRVAVRADFSSDEHQRARQSQTVTVALK